jgi:16S rRNA processing protein RimM
MIREDDITLIGRFIKPHGIRGELLFSYTSDVFDGSECSFFLCSMDGLPVPFRIESYRICSDVSATVKLKDVDSEMDARKFIGVDIYFPNCYFRGIANLKAAITWDFFVGFTVIDTERGEIGKIIAINKATLNLLLVVKGKKQEVFIPAVESWIVKVHLLERKLEMRLPEGL